MGHSHTHTHDSGPTGVSNQGRAALFGALALCFAATVVGLVLLWPTQRHFSIPAQYTTSQPVQSVAGKVIRTVVGDCGGEDDTTGDLTTVAKALADHHPLAQGEDVCERTAVVITSGPDKGGATVLALDNTEPVLHVGDAIRLGRATGVPDSGSGGVSYYFLDYARGVPLLVLAAIFAVVVIAVARLRGLASIVGLGATFAVLLFFILPALLSGRPPTPVALVGGATILFPVLYLTHGLSVRTSTALLGTLAALGAVGALAAGASHFTHLTGLQDEQNLSIHAYAPQVSISGLLLAGMVIGGLGILNDVTVTQASAAYEITQANPSASWTSRYASTMRVGRDHIASTVYTLALAYAGGALPILLLFNVAGRSLHDVVTSDIVADELVRALVGGIGIVLAVPITTALACYLAHPAMREDLAGSEHN